MSSPIQSSERDDVLQFGQIFVVVIKWQFLQAFSFVYYPFPLQILSAYALISGTVSISSQPRCNIPERFENEKLPSR